MKIQWRRGVVAITTAQLHSKRPELRYAMVRISEWSHLEIRLNAFRRSTIPQKQFIFIIIDKGININKTNDSRKSKIFHYICFLKTNFSFQPNTCGSCYGLLQKGMKFREVIFFSVKRNNYKIHFWGMSEDETINIIKNANLSEQCRLI